MILLSRLPDKPLSGFFLLPKGNRILFLFVCLCTGITVAAEMFMNLILKYFFDSVFAHQVQRALVINLVLLILLLAVIQAVFSFLSGRGAARVALAIAHWIRTSLFNKIQLLSYAYHDKARIGELIQKSGSDVECVQNLYSEHFVNIAKFIFLIVLNFTAIYLLDTSLAFFSLIMVPVLAILSIIFFRIISRAFRRLQEQEGIISHSIQEYLTGVRVVKAFARQELEEKKFDDQNLIKLKLAEKWRLYFSFFWPASHLICVIQMALALALSGYLTFTGSITIGIFIAYNSLLNGVIWPLQHLGKLISELSMGFVSYRRIAAVLNEQEEDLTTGRELPQFLGKIEFRNVQFAYREGQPVLQDIAFNCRPGEVIALAGETGSGKSTLLKLLPRFYEVTGGEIRIDDTALTELSRQYLRKQIGIVEQQPFLFSTTIEENLKFGAHGTITQDEMIAAAQAADVHNEISAFPDGYQTIIGEKGVTLSGGQQQRIALARTLLKKPALLILDDFTSAVDASTENRIKPGVAAWMKGRTIFMVTHRLQSLLEADRILVFNQGRIVQQGTHAELALQEGPYRKIYEYQVRIEDALKKEIENARKAI